MHSAEATPVSALSTFIQSVPPQSTHPAYLQTLALQIQHNLQYQHDWTALRIHAHSPLTQQLLPRPLISGLPPHRIYVHPDDQIDELKKGAKNGAGAVEREWILPTQLKEKWSLKRFGEVFDMIGEEPPMRADDGVTPAEGSDEALGKETSSKRRRGGKRLLLATLGDDSTVVYYIVHDGIVKPRQN